MRRSKCMNHTDGPVEAYYVVSFRDESFPELIGYSKNVYIAKSYATQWKKCGPTIHTVYGTSIEDACKDDSEVCSIIKGYSTLNTDEDAINVVTLIDNSLKRIVGTHLHDEYFLYTNRQIADVSDSGCDIITEAGNYLFDAVVNIVRISKYVRDPMFKQVIDFVMNKYITIIAVLELAYGDGTAIKYEELAKISTKIPYAYDEYFPFDIGEFIDLFYLDYIAIKNNAG